MWDPERARALEGHSEFWALFAALPTPYLVLSPQLVIVEANDAYVATVSFTRQELIGREVFSIFPRNPDALNAQGQSAAEVAMIRVLNSGRPESLPIYRYPLPGPDGTVTDKYWLIVIAPVLDQHRNVSLLVERIEDVTAFISERRQANRPVSELDPASDHLRRRAEVIEADLFIRAQDLAVAVAARDAAAAQVAALAEVALALSSAETLEDLERIVVGRGITVLGADGGAVISPAPDGGWRVTASATFGDYVQMTYRNLPYDSPLPPCWTARTGERLLLPTRAAGIAFTPAMEQAYRDTQREGWAFLPLAVGGSTLGCLAVSWVHEHELVPAELRLLDGLAAQCGQALYRIRTAEAQRATAREIQQLAETLQEALLTPPPEPAYLQVVARYRPAADIAQVGGDWYDAFLQPDGATMLVIGDVMGHDAIAAARMGQLRGLLRALAYTAHGLTDTPAAILTRFEHAARGLAVDTLATAILARIESSPSDANDCLLRWSNAGHPPPVLLRSDGSTELLEASRTELLLGVNPDALRSDYTIRLPENSTLLLYTDGLIERRGIDLDRGIADLRAAVSDLAQRPLDELCDSLLARLAAHTGDDDIALLAVRNRPSVSVGID